MRGRVLWESHMVLKASAEANLAGVRHDFESVQIHPNKQVVVEIELRLPSMLHGKKGFDRIVYAFKNVLKSPVTWLFKDLGQSSTFRVLVIEMVLTAS